MDACDCVARQPTAFPSKKVGRYAVMACNLTLGGLNSGPTVAYRHSVAFWECTPVKLPR